MAANPVEAASTTPLRGVCACGRNEYLVLVPEREPITNHAHVYFDSSAANRRHQAAPLTAWLRVPLTWYHSTTYAFFPDETHTSIRRTYTSSTPHSHSASTEATSHTDGASESEVRRQFCGYCGTPLSAWTEATADDAQHISLTLGSLIGDDLDRLERMGLLPESSDDEQEDGKTAAGTDVGMSGTEPMDVGSMAARPTHALIPHDESPRGFPWFEESIRDTPLGKMRRQRGGGFSADGATRVEWEVVQINDDRTEDDGDRSKRLKTG